MKAALLQVAILTDPRLIYHVLEKGFDFVFFQSSLDGGGASLKVEVVRKKTGPSLFDNSFSSLFGAKSDAVGYFIFFGKANNNNLLELVKDFFSDSGVEVSELDMFDANSIKDVDEIISQASN